MSSRATLVSGLLSSLLLMLMSAGCEQGPTSPTATGKSSPRSVTTRFSWLLRAWNLPFVVAKERGFYQRRGIQVEVNEGKGDSLTCELVSNGQETFAMTDAFTGAVAISKGANLKFVAMFVQKNPSSIIFHPSQRIERPEDLKGKRGGISPAGASTILLKAVLSQHGIGEDQLQLTAMAPHSKKAALLSGQVDYINGFINGDYLAVRLEDATIQAVPYHTWDVSALNMGVITHPDTIEKEPQLVRDFVAATVEGWRYMMEHPQEASAMGVKRFPLSDRAVLEEGIEVTVPLLYTANSRGRPLGWMAEADWEKTVELISLFGESEPVQDLEKYYTNEFIESR